jgi:glycosyltransferase involved in cell wall biosynthesis
MFDLEFVVFMSDLTSKRRLLVFVPNYLPGYKLGGILRTLVNTVDWLADDYEFWIVTRDRDLGEDQPFAGIDVNNWQRVQGAMVRYLAPHMITTRYLTRLVAQTPHDAIHLNSFFDPVFTMKILLARWLGWLPSGPLILSPRGEFGEGSLRLKYPKKLTYLTITRLIGFYKGVTWHASSIYEQQDSINALNVDVGNVRIALDLPSKVNLASQTSPISSDSRLRVVFLSRLSREKNLDYVLRVLKMVRAQVVFDIYGPDEDAAYWSECQQLIRELPGNVTATYHGPVVPSEVAAVFSRYDLFFFPSSGENYGHVIAESISVGTKVLISKNTPWLELQREQLGWDVGLEDERRFADLIEAFAALSLEERLQQRAVVKVNASARLLDPKVVSDNRELFKVTA